MSDEREQNVIRGDDGVEPSLPQRGGRWWHFAAPWVLVAVLLMAVNAIRLIEVDIADPRQYTMVMIGICAGLPIVGVAILYLLDARRAATVTKIRDISFHKRPQIDTQEPEPPAPFEKRLAAYLHVPEEEVLMSRERPVSAMPFWSAVELPRRSTLAKSLAYIRRILLRIRAAVRGD